MIKLKIYANDQGFSSFEDCSNIYNVTAASIDLTNKLFLQQYDYILTYVNDVYEMTHFK